MKTCILFILAITAGTICRGQVAAWDVYGLSFPVTVPATTWNPGLVSSAGATDITRGPGAPASGGVNSFRTLGFQNNGISVTADDYFQVTLQPLPGYRLSLSTLDARFNGTSTFFTSPGVTSQFAYSLNGVTFTLIGNPVQTTSLTLPQISLSAITDLQHIYNGTTVTLRYYASGQTTTGGWGFYPGSAGVNGLAIGGTVEPVVVTAPALQAASIVFTNIQQNSMTVAFTPGDGEKRVVKINTVNSFTPPADGTDPPANPVYIGTGEQVIYNYSGSSVPSVTGLTAGNMYWFRVYEYNGSGALTLYNPSVAPGNPAGQAASTTLLPPAIGAPSLSGITPGSAILGGHITSDGGSPLSERGTVWSLASPVALTDHPRAEGGTDTGLFSHIRDTLPAATLIRFRAYARNAAGTTLTDERTFYTPAIEPPAPVTNFAAVASGTTAVDLTWTPAGPGTDGYLVLMKQGTFACTGIPVDTNAYPPGTTMGDGTVVAVVTPGTAASVTVTGLLPGTEYTFTIFPYAWDGQHPPTLNYLTQPPAPSVMAATALPAVMTYHWTGATGTSWMAAANWNPARTVPAPNDILIFDIGGAWTLSDIPSQTLGQLKVQSNTSVTLQGTATLTLAGDTGDDLVVEAGCQLNASGTGAIAVSLSPGASGPIGGSVTFSGGGHRLLAASAGGIHFTQGSQFKAATGFSGNPFGTSSLNSVVFEAGSVYLSLAGGNPFGAAAPASVVVFQPSSLFRVDAYVVPSFGGRTYGDFEMNFSGLITVTGSAAVSIGNFTATQGNFYFNVTGNPGHTIRGNVQVGHLGTLFFSPSSPGTVKFNGTSAQAIGGYGSLMAGANSTLLVANPAGVKLNMQAQFQNLTIQAGAKFTVAPAGRLTVSGDLVNGSAATGLVVEPDGSLINSTSGVEGTVKRSIGAADWGDWRDGWHFLASPVTGQAFDSAGGFITTGPGHEFDLYAWSEPDQSWVNYANTASPPFFAAVNGSNLLEPGRGYLAAYQQEGIKQFRGVLNSGDRVVNGLTCTGDSTLYRGWHLLGNPFPCALTWFTGWNPVNIGGVAYTWNEAGRSYTPRNPGDILPACNGFMAEVIGAGGTTGSLTIPAANRVHDGTAWFRQSPVPVLRLLARNLDHPSFQETQVRFDPASDKRYDPASDGRFLPGYAPQFYSVAEGCPLGVNTMPYPGDGQVLSLGFIKNEGDHFRIEAIRAGEIPGEVILIDRKTGSATHLNATTSYDFTAEEGDRPDRFLLSFENSENRRPPGGRTTVTASGNSIVLHIAGETRAEVFSLSGERLRDSRFLTPGTADLVADAPAGWYFVRLTTGGRSSVTRVFLSTNR